MQFSKTLIAAAAALASLAANAVPVATVGLTGTSFLTLTSTSTGGTFTGAATGTITGGQVLTNDSVSADKDSFNGILPTVTNFLSAGPTATSPSTFLLNGAGTSFLSFLWGSPDSYNGLSVTTTSGTTSFKAADIGLPTGGSQTPGSAKYVAFTTTGGELIKSLTFTSTTDAFEAANFSVTAPVPEPETYALMLAGLGVLGFVARRRKPV